MEISLNFKHIFVICARECHHNIDKKKTQKKHPALIDESQELDEMELEIDHLFSEYDKKIKSKTDIDLDDETPNNSNQVSSWA